MLQPYEWEIEVKINDRDWEGTNFNGWDLMGKSSRNLSSNN